MISEWLLTVRESRPRAAGFVPLRRRRFTWDRVQVARGLVIDHSYVESPGQVALFKAAAPELIDIDAVNELRGGVAAARVEWAVPGQLGLPGGDRDTQLAAFQELTHAAGRVLLLTGDLGTYWHARMTGREVGFGDVCGKGDWAAWVPLRVSLSMEGVGFTQPDI